MILNKVVYIENHDGRLESRKVTSGLFNIFQKGSQLFFGYVQNYELLPFDFQIKKDVFISKGIHKFNMFSGFFESDKNNNIAVRTEAAGGQFYNGHFARINASGFLKLSSHLNMELLLTWNQFNLPVKGGKFASTIATSRIIYSFTPDLFPKAFLQWNSTEELLISNFLVRWIYKPGVNVYLIYKETRQPGSRGYLLNRVLMLKISFLFNF